MGLRAEAGLFRKQPSRGIRHRGGWNPIARSKVDYEPISRLAFWLGIAMIGLVALARRADNPGLPLIDIKLAGSPRARFIPAPR